MRTRFFSLVAMLALGALCGESVAAESTPAPDPWKLNLGVNKPRPKNARTIIDNEEGAWFDDATNTLEFQGNVVVRDPQFTLFCDKLHVVMNPNRQGLQKIIATGNVIIQQDNTNDQGGVIKTIARAGEVLYEPATGDMTLTHWPEIQQGVNCQVGTEEGTIMILNGKGTSRTIGQSRIMVVDPNKTK
jgi:lipopolysaccharide transport protein LptA